MVERSVAPVVSPGGVALVSGAARSGKSAWAERIAAASGLDVLYLATGPSLPEDQAWQERLTRHRQRRPSFWRSEEIGAALPQALNRWSQPQHLLLVDSLGTWLAHHIALDESGWQHQRQDLITALGDCQAAVVLVAEEGGWGVVPATAIGGLFRDRLGELLEALEPLCARSWLVIRGRALDLHQIGVPIMGA
ncbi:MAG: bifunctional adenosylcobinamide kinase/adenosylcobinamide-phosphate guanylyltransferase [Cyanobacteriota bacterium]